MNLLDRIKTALLRRSARIKVEITCPHGEFIPGAYTPGKSSGRYSCRDCGFNVRLSTFRGDVTW